MAAVAVLFSSVGVRARHPRFGQCTQSSLALLDGVLGAARSALGPFDRAARPEVMARVGAMIAATPAAGYIGCGQAIPLMNTTARLAQLRCPALVIAGADDAGMTSAMGRRIADHLPGARLKVIESAAHLCNLEQKDSFNISLLEFLLA